MKKSWIVSALVLLTTNFAVGCSDSENRKVEAPVLDAAEQQKEYDDYDQQQAAANKDYK
ncbi:hypothetical protein [Allorhodopirellula heiligendammensis]|uniref:Secreted protein n=1 Tax=Allorhodopirellula heiligendammensis TaxID=2714739 RepID=A0A5C6BX91_9BACT|nr:hypothetical protein [Allorhodopirellula heiligendammensis]TWU16131.1 hypothetical protein Poly21_33360 [Allorhodopirellula heiligendammensis]|tara:strand:- start:291 stop:467 length:177 start_codon:yes stop_codon:yes gene_type:complete